MKIFLKKSFQYKQMLNEMKKNIENKKNYKNYESFLKISSGNIFQVFQFTFLATTNEWNVVWPVNSVS